MKCEAKCEAMSELLPLYVECDLDEHRGREVESHLCECTHCETALEELRESQSILKSLRRDIVSAEVLAQVRQRAFSEGAAAASTAVSKWMFSIERTLFLGFRRRLVFATALSIILLSAVTWQLVQRPQTANEPVRTAFNPPAAPVVPRPVEVASKPVRKSAKIVKRPRNTPTPLRELADTSPTTESTQIVVKILTDDPNIVIYWLLDQEGGV